MAARSEPTQGPDDLTLRLTRTFDAPRRLVFQLWVQPEHATHWWGPRGFTVPFQEADVRPGGRYRRCLRSPAGVDHWQVGTYLEIAEPERLAFTMAWEGPDGRPGHQTLVTVTFVETHGRTTLTLHQSTFDSTASRDDHRGGWSDTLDRLAEHLGGPPT